MSVEFLKEGSMIHYLSNYPRQSRFASLDQSADLLD